MSKRLEGTTCPCPCPCPICSLYHPSLHASCPRVPLPAALDISVLSSGQPAHSFFRYHDFLIHLFLSPPLSWILPCTLTHSTPTDWLRRYTRSPGVKRNIEFGLFCHFLFSSHVLEMPNMSEYDMPAWGKVSQSSAFSDPESPGNWKPLNVTLGAYALNETRLGSLKIRRRHVQRGILRGCARASNKNPRELQAKMRKSRPGFPHVPGLFLIWHF